MTKLSNHAIANFMKLAAYLEGLPKNYKHFNMRSYVGGADPAGADDNPLAATPENIMACGTYACALGHAVCAGIKPEAGWNWNDFAEHAFDAPHFPDEAREVYARVFDGDLEGDHRAAARRIRSLLDDVATGF